MSSLSLNPGGQTDRLTDRQTDRVTEGSPAVRPFCETLWHQSIDLGVLEEGFRRPPASEAGITTAAIAPHAQRYARVLIKLAIVS